MFIIGGAETFPKTFASAVHRLWQHPEQRARVRRGTPSLIPDAYQEALRYDMPTQFLMRVMTNDVTLHGVTMRKGRPVMFLYPSANRDRREFPDPDRFDIKRKPPRILTFGHGIHACIGRHFAQMEGKLCFEKLLAHAPKYEVQESRAEAHPHRVRAGLGVDAGGLQPLSASSASKRRRRSSSGARMRRSQRSA